MPHDDLVAIGALLAIPLAGFPISCLLRLRGSLAVACWWLFGTGVICALLLALSSMQIRYTRPSLALGYALVVGLLLLAARAGGSWPWPGSGFLSRRSDPFHVLLLAICGVQVAYVTLQAVRVPLGSFDAWSLWEYKGRLFSLHGGISASLVRDNGAIFAHPAYPPLLLSLITWVYTWMGSADPAPMKLLFPAFFAALLCAFHAGLRPALGQRTALFGTALLALIPRLAAYAGTGLADVPLAASVVAAAAIAAGWRTPDRRALLGAGLLLGIAVCLKREGLVFAGAGVLSALLAYRSVRDTLFVALPAAVVGGPWLLYTALSGAPDRDFLPLTLHNVLLHSDRLTGNARLFTLNALALNEWNLLWFAFIVALLVGLRRRRLAEPLLLLSILLPLLVYIVVLTLSAWPDPDLHARTSLDRLILVTAPFALWFTIAQFAGRTPKSQVREDG